VIAEEAVAAVVLAIMLLMLTAMPSLCLRLVSHSLQVIVLVFFVQWRMRLLPGWLQKAVDSVSNQVDGSYMRGGV
jgi:MFS superfamily sulfate permease-like transporter